MSDQEDQSARKHRLSAEERARLQEVQKRIDVAFAHFRAVLKQQLKDAHAKERAKRPDRPPEE